MPRLPVLRGSLILATLLLVLLSICYTHAVDLSPENWPPEIFKQFEKLENEKGPHPPAFSKNKGMVSGIPPSSHLIP